MKPYPQAKFKPRIRDFPPWSPRFWNGMLLGDWLRLLIRNRLRIDPLRLGIAFIITGCTAINSLLQRVQGLVYGRRIDQTPIKEPPLFIIGHWRSGTTFLHELLACDKRFAFPTTYACFAPNHFLLTAWIIPRLLGFLLPKKRPMDNMQVSFARPQEDEFALANMGCSSPYLRILFPNEPPCHLEFLNMEGIPANELKRWKHDMVWFAKALTLQSQKPLVFKSPTHTGRVEVLSELFPGARFIHMTRDPYTLFASTRALWSALDSTQGLQPPRNEHLEEYVFTCFELMYRGFEQQRGRIDPKRICDVRYEDLISAPLEQLEAIYKKIGISDFEHVRLTLKEYLTELKDYQPNRHEELDDGTKAEIRRRWGKEVKSLS
jgi:omega-hydroxy-beta-dihydromenaquinone-9 sulfotransferase